jgi:hypothetical protein
LTAFSENNAPRFDWGPKKKANQYGFYARLRNDHEQAEQAGPNYRRVHAAHMSTNEAFDDDRRNSSDADVKSTSF